MYSKWPVNDQGLPMDTLPDQFMEKDEFIRFCKDLKKRAFIFFPWYPGRFDPRPEFKNQIQEKPDVMRIWNNEPKMVFRRTEKYPDGVRFVNLTTGIFADKWFQLQGVFETSKIRHDSHSMNLEDVKKQGQEAAALVKGIAYELERIEYRAGFSYPGGSYDGVCSDVAFEKKFKWVE